MRAYYLLISIFYCLSCNQGKSIKHDSEKHSAKEYFEFDKILYFKISVSERGIDSLLVKENKTSYEKDFLKIVAWDDPQKLSDIDTNRLIKLGYKESNITTTNYPAIRRIFSDKAPTEGYVMSCEAIYRDILIFLKNDNITGLAKICFGCHQYRFIGQKINTTTFGSNSDYSDLSKILYH